MSGFLAATIHAGFFQAKRGTIAKSRTKIHKLSCAQTMLPRIRIASDTWCQQQPPEHWLQLALCPPLSPSLATTHCRLQHQTLLIATKKMKRQSETRLEALKQNLLVHWLVAGWKIPLIPTSRERDDVSSSLRSQR